MILILNVQFVKVDFIYQTSREMIDERILSEWKAGLTVTQISKLYMENKKKKGIKITQLDAQKYVEPLIFKYQTDLMRV